MYVAYIAKQLISTKVVRLLHACTHMQAGLLWVHTSVGRKLQQRPHITLEHFPALKRARFDHTTANLVPQLSLHRQTSG